MEEKAHFQIDNHKLDVCESTLTVVDECVNSAKILDFSYMSGMQGLKEIIKSILDQCNAIENKPVNNSFFESQTYEEMIVELVNTKNNDSEFLIDILEKILHGWNFINQDTIIKLYTQVNG